MTMKTRFRTNEEKRQNDVILQHKKIMIIGFYGQIILLLKKQTFLLSEMFTWICET